jgi:hypothetical protein
MFVGHFGVALAAKRVAPRTSLATLFLASSFIDVLWPILLLLGLEEVRIVPGLTAFSPLDFVSYPITHSAIAVLGWSAAFGLAYLALRRERSGALVAALLVASHWMLDAVVHRPDLPLWPGGPRVGAGLWGSVAGTLALELAIFAAGLAVYLASTRARRWPGTAGLAILVALLLAAYVGAAFGPPPPDARTIAIAGLAGAALALLLAAWVDRARTARGARAEGAPAAG